MGRGRLLQGRGTRRHSIVHVHECMMLQECPPGWPINTWLGSKLIIANATLEHLLTHLSQTFPQNTEQQPANKLGSWLLYCILRVRLWKRSMQEPKCGIDIDFFGYTPRGTEWFETYHTLQNSPQVFEHVCAVPPLTCTSTEITTFHSISAKNCASWTLKLVHLIANCKLTVIAPMLKAAKFVREVMVTDAPLTRRHTQKHKEHTSIIAPNCHCPLLSHSHLLTTHYSLHQAPTCLHLSCIFQRPSQWRYGSYCFPHHHNRFILLKQWH